MGPVELVLDPVEALPFLGFDIPSILPGESYIGLCALAKYVVKANECQQVPKEILPSV